MTFMLIPVAHYYLPNRAQIEFAGKVYTATRWKLYGCVNMGLWTGLFVGYVTEFYTSSQFEPVVSLAEAARMGAGPSVIAGLAVGMYSTIITIILLAVTVYMAFTFAGMYGIALAAIGMLGCLPVALSLDAYGPIADNAGGIAEMSQLGNVVRRRTDKMDAAGNTTAAIGKGFAIGSACLVSLALFGGFITRVEEEQTSPKYIVNALEPITFAGIMIGSMVPYAFSAMTINAVGDSA
jgi:inorganic pyrophosphatase